MPFDKLISLCDTIVILFQVAIDMKFAPATIPLLYSHLLNCLLHFEPDWCFLPFGVVFYSMRLVGNCLKRQAKSASSVESYFCSVPK